MDYDLVFSHHPQRVATRLWSLSSSYLLISVNIKTYPQCAMAETLGVIASGFQVAGLIGTITKAGFQIRALCHEIQDAPNEIAFRLEELDVLSGIIKESNSISSNARNLCGLCLSELRLILAELQSQIHRSRGIRNKVASAKVILKKDLIQKLDSRLKRSVQWLMLAIQIDTSSTQSLVLRNQGIMSSNQALLLHKQDAML